MARVALIQPFSVMFLPAASISAALKSQGHEVLVVYFKLFYAVRKDSREGKRSPSKIGQIAGYGFEVLMNHFHPVTETEMGLLNSLLDDFEPDLIGFNVVETAFDTVARITEELRQEHGVPIIWGGTTPTLQPERCLEYADLVCVGEGDEAIVELAQIIDQGGDWHNVQNIWCTTGDEVVKNPCRPLIQDLDSLPFPDYSLDDRYLIDDDQLTPRCDLPRWEGSYITMTSRGCPFSCTFCSEPAERALYDGQKYFRRRSPGSAIAELRHAKEHYGPNFVWFYDNLFTTNRRWIREFAEAYRTEIDLPFFCYTYPGCAAEDTLVMLRDCGLAKITCGMQSGSQRILWEVFRRKTARRAILETAKLMERLGLDYDFDLISNNPFETEADLVETLELLLEMPSRFKLNFLSGVNKLAIFPQTQLYHMVQEEQPKPLAPRVYDFYNRLYIMAQRRFPKRITAALSRSRLLKRFPFLLALLFPSFWADKRDRVTRLFGAALASVRGAVKETGIASQDRQGRQSEGSPVQ
jgi:radical SAM superfamily enzyme YgiQ (UPF0313 family)